MLYFKNIALPFIFEFKLAFNLYNSAFFRIMHISIHDSKNKNKTKQTKNKQNKTNKKQTKTNKQNKNKTKQNKKQTKQITKQNK